MIKPSGAWCDICEKPILTGMVNCFGMLGLDNTLHSCNDCKHHFEGPGSVNDWPDCEVKRQMVALADKASGLNISGG